MTPDRSDQPNDDDIENGVLDATGAIDTTSIDFLAGTSGQVTVSIPGETDHDLEDDDDVIGDEVAFDLGAQVEHDASDAEPFRDGSIVVVLDDPEPAPAADDEAHVADDESGVDEVEQGYEVAEADAYAPVDDGDAAEHTVAEEASGEAEPDQMLEDSPEPAAAEEQIPVEPVEAGDGDGRTGREPDEDADAAAPASDDALDVHVLAQRWLQGGSTWAVEAELVEQTGEMPVVADSSEPYADEDITDAVEVVDTGEHHAMTDDLATAHTIDTATEIDAAEPLETDAPADAEESAVNEETSNSGEPAAEPVGPVTGGVSTRREAHANAVQSARSVERVAPRADLTLTSKRLGEFEADRETADLLTADRLLDPNHTVRAEPEGTWQHFVYRISGHRINLGDSKRARARKELDRRIAGALPGGARFVPVVSRKGGVGKTTVTTLLGMALADARDDRVIAIDANPDRGTLADRIARSSDKTVRDLVKVRGEVLGYNDLSSIVARDETRLDVIASDADPRIAEAFNDEDYDDVATLAAHYYSLVLTDTGTGIVHSVMGATLGRADQLVIVAGLSVDEARLASETITWLETNGFAELARRAVIVLNNARPGQPLVRPEELEEHFRTRVRDVVRVPYDPHIATGSAISFRELSAETRQAARELAAVVVEGLRTMASAA